MDFYSLRKRNLRLLKPVASSSGRADAGEAGIWHESDFRLWHDSAHRPWRCRLSAMGSLPEPEEDRCMQKKQRSPPVTREVLRRRHRHLQ
jgi:hypothetical protein